MSYRIIVWGTGFVGKSVLKDLLDHPNYEIAGVIVNSTEKDGKDLGEILGGKKNWDSRDPRLSRGTRPRSRCGRLFRTQCDARGSQH